MKLLKLRKLWKIKTKTTRGTKKKGGMTYKTKKTFYYITCNFANYDKLQAADRRDDAT